MCTCTDVCLALPQDPNQLALPWQCHKTGTAVNYSCDHCTVLHAFDSHARHAHRCHAVMLIAGFKLAAGWPGVGLLPTPAALHCVLGWRSYGPAAAAPMMSEVGLMASQMRQALALSRLQQSSMVLQDNNTSMTHAASGGWERTAMFVLWSAVAIFNCNLSISLPHYSHRHAAAQPAFSTDL